MVHEIISSREMEKYNTKFVQFVCRYIYNKQLQPIKGALSLKICHLKPNLFLSTNMFTKLMVTGNNI